MRNLGTDLARREAEGLRRERILLESPQGPRVRVGGREYLAFCSNDYLGLANHPAMVNAVCQAARVRGRCAGASHLITGHSVAHHELEARLAEFAGFPRALLFSTGYMANLGVVTALAGRGDMLFADRLNHASLNDAVLLSRAKMARYPHCDLAALERRMKGSAARRKIVVTDGVFSMDGDLAPLPGIVALCERHDAWLLVDDAHGFGVLGQRAGAPVAFRRCSQRVIYMGTLGKAAGVFGAFVAAAPEIIETLIQRARTYIYTTALPPLLASAAKAGVDLIERDEWRRQRLAQLIELAEAGHEQQCMEASAFDTPIQPLVVGDSRMRGGAGQRSQGARHPGPGDPSSHSAGRRRAAADFALRGSCPRGRGPAGGGAA